MAKSTIGFSVYLDGKLINEVTFDRPIINVGKLSTSTLRIDDVNVSRKHAVIEQREDGKWRITDLGSTNGTVLRGERVVQSELKDGDRLVLGTTTLVVHISEGLVARAPEASPIVSGTAGTPADSQEPEAPAGVVAARAEVSGPAPTTGHKPDEIRGLGAESFYKKKTATEGNRWALDVAVLWDETVLASKSFEPGQSVVFGEGQHVDFAMPPEVLGGREFKLVEGTPNGFALVVSNPNVTGDVLMGEQVRTTADLAAEGRTIPVQGALKARLKIGDFTVLLSHAPAVAVVAAKRTFEKEPLLFILASAIVQIVFLIAARGQPDELLMTTRDPRAEREKVLQALKVTPEELEQKKKEEEKKEEEVAKKRADLVAEDLIMAPTEVTPVAELAQPQERRNPLVDKMARKPREDVARLSPTERQARAKEMAQSTALNQALRDNPMLADLLQTNPDLDARPTNFKALGANDPNAPGSFTDGGNLDPFGGTFAGGPSGFSPDGGGIPTGGPDGGPLVADIGKQTGRDLNDLRFTDKPVEPRVMELPPRLSGELDEKTVQQYIRRFLSGIKWCYQDRLQSNRKLGGKVTLAFTILPNGTVLDPRTVNSSLDDASLEECIRNKMARWKFPSPKDGGVVEVAYPLILKTQ
ncbi:MAG TPA: AgmX/PglI C-terminal domain-containing protein [Myxococcota bacterium]|nr:AgmX/PglI C-terminal domain-containing protein [Myxococcota bacterium]